VPSSTLSVAHADAGEQGEMAPVSRTKADWLRKNYTKISREIFLLEKQLCW
jgi:hypothetical protein